MVRSILFQQIRTNRRVSGDRPEFWFESFSNIVNGWFSKIRGSGNSLVLKKDFLWFYWYLVIFGLGPFHLKFAIFAKIENFKYIAMYEILMIVVGFLFLIKY